jgi:hypothetical protein
MRATAGGSLPNVTRTCSRFEIPEEHADGDDVHIGMVEVQCESERRVVLAPMVPAVGLGWL